MGGFFKKIVKGIAVGGKTAWRVANSPEGQVMISIFAPATVAKAALNGVKIANEISAEHTSNKKREQAKKLVLSGLENEERAVIQANPKLLNFMIEAMLQKMEGNANVD